MHPLLTIAVRAARRAGEIIARSLPRLESIAVTAKGRNDFVSEVERLGHLPIDDKRQLELIEESEAAARGRRSQ